MSGLDYTRLEVIGFTESAQLDCERPRPVYRDKSNRFFTLSGQELRFGPSSFFQEADIEDYAREGRLIKLPEPVPAQPQAVVLTVRQPFLSALGRGDLPEEFNWRSLPAGQQRGWVTYAPAEAVQRSMRAWAQILLEKATSLLTEFFSEGREELRQQAEQVAELGLEAARDDQDLLCRTYLRLGLALADSSRPERLANRLQFMESDCPGLTRESFLRQMQLLRSVFAVRALGWSLVQKSAEHPAEVLHEGLRQGIDAVKGVSGKEAQLKKAGEVAQMYRGNGLPAEWKKRVQEVARDLRRDGEGWYCPTDGIVKLLLREPAPFCPGVVVPRSTGLMLSNVLFWGFSEECRLHGVPLGEISQAGLAS
jgi:hypothetical protein